MKPKVVFQTRGYPLKDIEPADAVFPKGDGGVVVHYKDKQVAVVNNHRGGIIAAFVVKPKRKRWKLKLVKE